MVIRRAIVNILGCCRLRIESEPQSIRALGCRVNLSGAAQASLQSGHNAHTVSVHSQPAGSGTQKGEEEARGCSGGWGSGVGNE